MKYTRYALIGALLAFLVQICMTHISAQSPNLPPTFFSEYYPDGSNQLRVFRGIGQIYNVFSTNNEGNISSVSPDGSIIAFRRLNGVHPNVSSELWLGNIQSGQQWSISTAGVKSVGSLWSPNSRYVLLLEYQAIVPLWAGYNYGQLSIYDIVARSKTTLTGISAQTIGWFSDSQSILLWNDTAGYFRYFLSNGSTQTVEIIDLVDRKYLSGSELSPSTSRLAILWSDASIQIYDGKSGIRLKSISPAIFGSRRPNIMSWSPQMTYLAIQLDDTNLIIWDDSSNTVVAQITNPLVDRSFQLNWTADGQYAVLIFSGAFTTSIYYVTAQTGQVSKVHENSTATIRNTPTVTLTPAQTLTSGG